MTNMRTLILLFSLLLGVGLNLASAQGTLSPVGQQVFLDNSGNPLNNAKICTYAAGTSTPLATYSDVTLMTANANPVRTSSAGRPTTGGLYLSPTSYKFLVLTAGTDSTCSTGTTIWTQDNISAVPAANVALDATGTAGEALALGDAVFLSAGDGGLTAGRWYKADADNTYRSSTAGTVGMAVAAIASGVSGSIRLSGRLTGLSALTAGEIYYASATAGAVTATPPTNQRLIGQADSTTSIVIGGNPGGVRLPDNDGTHFLSIIVPTNLTADRLFNLIVPDAAVTLTITGDATIPATAQPADKSIVQGRLTLTTGTAVTTGDVSAATTLYWALYGGNQISLYTGSTWTTVNLSQLSITLVGLTASKPYDVFIDYTAGTPALEVVVWTNDTTRATALATQDGVYVQTADPDSRYVGTIYIDSGGGAVTDSYASRHVWNYYNRMPRAMRVLEATASWTYTTATWRQANGAAGNQLDFVIGVAEVPITATVLAAGANSGGGQLFIVGVGLDVTNGPTTGGLQGYNTVAGTGAVNLNATLKVFPSVGRHFAAWLEVSAASGTTTWNGSGNGAQSGITGEIQG